MAGATSKGFDTPDETRTPDKTRIDIVKLGSTEVGRFTFEPGWKWSDCIKPVVGGDACQKRHVGVGVSGTMHVEHADGTTVDIAPGAAYVLEPGHDAWVVGDDAFVGYEFEESTVEDYATPA